MGRGKEWNCTVHSKLIAYTTIGLIRFSDGVWQGRLGNSKTRSWVAKGQ